MNPWGKPQQLALRPYSEGVLIFLKFSLALPICLWYVVYMVIKETRAGGTEMYDPEAIYQDADIEMMELHAAANEELANRKAGNCSHGWTGPADDGKLNDKGGKEFQCYHCGHRFFDAAARDRELGFPTDW